MFLAPLLLVATTDWVPAMKPLEKQVVRIEMQQGDSKGSCSGSVIDVKRGYVLTAAHCVPEGENVSLTVNRRDAKAVKVNRILDLAILRFDPKGEMDIQLADKTPPSGTDVVVMGFGFGVKQAAPQFGHITLAITDDGERVWIDAVTLHGDSGGPVVDALGRLVAVTSQILYNGPAHISQAVRVEDVADFVVGYLPGK